MVLAITDIVSILTNSVDPSGYIKDQFTIASGRKTALIREAVNHFPGNFCATDIQLACPGVGIDMIRRVLKDLQAQGIIECLGWGRNAKWSKVEIR